jgi:dienelactone hydrolase
MQMMDAFNEKYPGKLVSYPSRAGKVDGKDLEVVQLGGWWLPAPNDDKGTAPRIVVQHGFTSNGNKYRQEYVAYLLRSLGFSVLVNNLRDHCYSDDSKARVVEWGHAYPYDLLGAWDYAQKAGGNKLDASKVGVLGFSMGGFITQNAFGLESKIPAVWVDGAPWTPFEGFKKGLETELNGMGIGFLLNLPLADAVWSNVRSAAEAKGVDLHAHLPEKVLLEGSDTARPIFVTANKNDATVPYSSSESLVALLKKNTKKYDLEEFWSHEAGCKKPSGVQSHCIDHVREPSAYKAKLCKFWTKAFDLSSDFCSGSKEEASRRLNLI